MTTTHLTESQRQAKQIFIEAIRPRLSKLDATGRTEALDEILSDAVKRAGAGDEHVWVGFGSWLASLYDTDGIKFEQLCDAILREI